MSATKAEAIRDAVAKAVHAVAGQQRPAAMAVAMVVW